MNAEEIIKRADKLKSDRGNWEENWQEIMDYVLPRKSNITTIYAKGEKRNTTVYDSTAIHANELLSASLQGTLSSSSTKWFGLRLRKKELNDIEAVKKWLQDCEKAMYRAFNYSNFRSESHESYLDLCTIGTACMLVEERSINQDGTWGGLRFRTEHVSGYLIDENADGIVDTVYRILKPSARQAYQDYKENLSEETILKATEKPDETIEIVHCVRPGTDVGVDSLFPFISVYVERKHKKIIRESGYREFPFAVPRWTKATGEVYGRSPSFNALPDIRTLNRAVELALRAWAKDIDPALILPDEGVNGKFKTQASALNYMRPDLIGKVSTVPSGARWDVTQIETEKLKESIRKIYFADQLQLQQGPQMTATEAQIRFELMQRLLGPTLGRLEGEYLNPIIQRVFQIMFRANQFPPVPRELQGEEVDVMYNGPLARAQRMNEMVAVQRWLESVGQIAQFAPAALDNVNTDYIVKMNAESLGVPVQAVRAQDEIDQIRNNRAQQMQQQQMMNNAQDAANVSKAMQ